MFWARPGALKPLLALDLSADDFVEDATGNQSYTRAGNFQVD